MEYNYVTLQCQLSDSDRRTAGQFIQFVDAQGVDYFENLCLKANQACKGMHTEKYPNILLNCDPLIQYFQL